MTQLKQVLGQVEAVNPSVAQRLHKLAEQYEYERLLQLLNSVFNQGDTAHE